MENRVTNRVTNAVTPPADRYRARQIDIEQLLIWTYQVQKADVADRMVNRVVHAGALGYGSDSFSACERTSGLGTAVHASPWTLPAVDPDAETVHDAVLKLPSQTTGLVIRHAKAGTRPEAYEGAVPLLLPRKRQNGKIVVNRDARDHPWLCPLRQAIGVPSRSGYRIAAESWDHIEFSRGIYVMWHAALCVLADALSGCLISHNPQTPSAPASPWKKPA